jgi:hypothetical protein
MVAPADPSVPGIVSTLQATASNALEATGGYLASAQAALTSEVLQETKQGVAGALDNVKINTIDAATASITTAGSVVHDPSQAASNAQAMVQPHVDTAHVDAAKQSASNLINSATQTAATTSNPASTQTQDVKATGSGYTTAAASTAEQPYIPKVQENGSAHAQSIQQEAQPLVDRAKGVANSQQGLVTPVGLPTEGIEGVLKYGEDKSDSAKQAEQQGEYPKVRGY